MSSPDPSKSKLVEMAEALVNDEFLYYFQPIVSLETGYITGAECLLRWKLPSGDVLSTADFIDLAESSGFIADIDYALIPKIGRALNELVGMDEGFYLTVNMAAGSLNKPDFADLLLHNLEAHQVDRQHLLLEVTERIVYPSTENIKATLERLVELQFKLVLDDFGIGHSSVRYLSSLPLKALKLDQSLIQRGPYNLSDFKIVRHLIGLGHQLGLGIIAEGVEDRETLELLASKGCTAVQGYLLARPMPLEELLLLVKAKQRLWEGYPFGLDYLAQIDHIDFRRDLIREVLILATTQDEAVRKRSVARLPDLDPRKGLFAHWYYQSNRLRKINEEVYLELGRRNEAFCDTCQLLLETALYNPDMKAIQKVIDQMSNESREVMSLAEKISADALLDYFSKKYVE